MKGKNKFESSGSVRVVESGRYHIKGANSVLPIGAALNFHTEVLHEVCFSEIRPLSQDFSVLLGAIKCADRSIMRHHATGWGREIAVTVPVFELATWSEIAVAQTLERALDYLTGDTWHVRFTARRGTPVFSSTRPLLSIPERSRIFIPFSHGLDSFAQRVLLNWQDPEVDVIPVHLRAGKTPISKKYKRSSGRGNAPPIQVAAAVNEPKHAEPSFRSRPFLYDGLAGYAAALSGGGRVVIPENGQGSLGGSLVRLGSEAPHRSCHPGFTTRLSSFLEALTGTRVTFEHPALFHTKGIVLSALKKLQPDSDAWLSSHSSCSYDSRHSNRLGKKIHCGVCGNCLLRRVALHAARIPDVTTYKFEKLAATRLEDSMNGADLTRNFSAFRDVARNGVRSMQRLANMDSRNDQYRIEAEAALIAKYLNRAAEGVKLELNSMLGIHSHEWSSFMSELGPSSWIAEYAKG